MNRIGFLGLGNMGSAMVARLIETGHDVLVWNRSTEAAAPLVALGATRAATPAEALAAPLSFSMFANDAAAEAVLSPSNLGQGGDRVHVNMASISPGAADRLEQLFADAGLGYVSAPVLGRPNVAASGGLNILVAGAPDHVRRAEPVLGDLSVRIWPFGDRPRRANVVKISVNYTILNALEALGESITLVESHDVDAVGFAELLAGTLFGGVVYSGYGSMIAERRYSPAGFSMANGLKDLGLAETVAAEGGVALPNAPVLREHFETALADPGLAELDWAAVAEVTRRPSAAQPPRG
jgi:hypothetical protein